MTGRIALLSLQGVLLVSLVFWSMPLLDLWASDLIHDSETGRFLGQGRPTLALLRGVTTTLIYTLAGVALGVLLLRLLPWHPPIPVCPRVCLFLIVSLLLGPVLTVNLVLKDQWGRPRPSQITEFGGERSFQAAWVPSAECHHNCSFVSGDAAGAIWLLAPAATLRHRIWRRTAYAGVLTLAASVGAARLLVGAHFLSDVLLAFLLTYLCIWFARWLVWLDDPSDQAPSPAGR